MSTSLEALAELWDRRAARLRRRADDFPSRPWEKERLLRRAEEVSLCAKEIRQTLAKPAPEPTIEVGDLVRYVPNGSLEGDDWVGRAWRGRTERDALVVSVPQSDADDGSSRADYRLASVFAPDEEPLWSDRDYWYAPAKNLRLVAKATYRRLG
jgi:hypothetical protein